MPRLFVLNLTLAILLLGACGKEKGGDRGATGGGSAAPVGESVAITGTLTLDTATTAPAAAATDMAGKQVELVDDEGEVIAQTVSGPDGAFSIALETQSLGLQAPGDGLAPRLARLRTLFLVPGAEAEQAVGLKQPIVINPDDLKRQADGTLALDTGRHAAKAVGAIVGKLTLETNGDPTGIEVYIPGTTDIAKADATGQFLLGFLPAGNFKLRADKDGYNSIEWDSVEVLRQQTTHLDASVLQIATGPKIAELSLKNLDEITGAATLALKLKAATKYRLSKLADFSDTDFKPVDARTPAFDVTMAIDPGVRLINVYLEAADSDGLSATKTLVIDREAPYGGQIAVADGKSLVASTTVSLELSATNATKMRFAESTEALATATVVPYATTYDYALTNTTDGSKTVYVEFRDEAGNATGAGGELAATFILDTTPPAAEALTLLPPASPTGAFDTPLAWLASFVEANATYEVQVFDNATYMGTALRSMSTSSTSVNVSPALDDEGVYYWRLRAVDVAGNASDWLSSGTSKSFTLRVLAESYQIRRDIAGEADVDVLVGREMTPVGDLNGDGYEEIAYSLMSSDIGDCTGCGGVRIFDQASGTNLATLTENQKKTSLYGHRVVACDVTGDGADEIVVAAPGAELRRNGYVYKNTGAVYVYDAATFERTATLLPTVGSTDPAPGFWCRIDHDPVTNMSMQICGWDQFPEPLSGYGAAAGGGDSRQFGQEVRCVRQSGADDLLVGEPGYYDEMMGMRQGRIGQYHFTNGTPAVVTGLNGTAGGGMYDFGTAFTHLSKFKYTAAGTCAVGPTLAVGFPNEWTGGNSNGRVRLYQRASASAPYTECATIDTDSSFDWTTQRWGARLHNLGNIDGDASDIEELAVATQAWEGGIVRIFGGTSGTLLHSLKRQGREYGYFGYVVKPSGEFAAGVQALAITSPLATVNGHIDAGAVFLYELSGIDDDDNDGDGTADDAPFLTLTGRPSGGAFLGASFVPNFEDADASTKPVSMFVSNPGRRAAGTQNCMPPMPCGGPMPGGMGASSPTGGLVEFAFLRLAPTQPTRLIGDSTKARLGSSIVGVPDIDGDGADDVILGQTGGRCLGRPYGMLSLYSVLDAKITRSLCGVRTGDEIGAPIIRAPSSDRLIFANLRAQGGSGGGSLFTISPQQLLTFEDLRPMIDNATQMPLSDYGRLDTISTDEPALAVLSGGGMAMPDILLAGNGGWDDAAISDVGRVAVLDLPTMPAGNAFGGNKTLRGSAADERFGVSVATLPDINGTAMASNQGEFVIGSPGRVAGTGTGAVFILDRDVMDGVIDPMAATTLLTITAEDAVESGVDAQEGFGSLVVGLPDLGNYDPTGENFDADAYVYVANTNMAHGTSTATPEYFIYAVRYDGGVGTKRLVKYGTGTAATMLGGQARRLPDINGDGVADLAIAHPGGQGQLGLTGNVQIISGKGLTTPDPDDDLMQLLYNPDTASANFGVAIEYADMTGDGLPDFIVGANEYDSNAYQDAGAVYIFTMAPVK